MSIDNGAPRVRGDLVAGVRVLGPSNPNASAGSASGQMVTGQVLNWAMITNPQQTVNATISSDPNRVVSSGAAVGTSGSAAGIGGISSVPTTTTISPAGTSVTTMAAATSSAMAVTPTLAASGLALSNAARTTTLRPSTARVSSTTTTSVAHSVRLVNGDAGRLVVTNAADQ